MAGQQIRLGIVGAGANTRSRHIPGFRAIEGVEIAAVANRTEESTRRVAEEYSIPKTYGSWQELVADPDLDAVMIGTWPSLHAEITVAALEAGRHVLTEARMARSLAEAKRMAAAAEARPELITQIVPSPFGLEEDAYLKELIGGGFLGELREVVLISATDLFHDRSAPLHWRQEEPNTMRIGYRDKPTEIWHAGANRTYLDADILAIQRTPGGHPEGYLEAFANIYRAFGESLRCESSGGGETGFATLEDTLAGMRFLDAALESSRKNAAWVKL